MNAFNNYFLDVITKKFFQFAGRAPRREFWYFMLFSIIISVVVGIAGEILGIMYMIPMEVPVISDSGEMINTTQNIPINILQTIFGLSMIFPSMAVSIRRLHDIGKSGWWYLVGLIPLIGAIVLLVFFTTKSENQTNKYGEIPTN
jgi:uncharacterized membrane protein YhaH (DUF805 family)